MAATGEGGGGKSNVSGFTSYGVHRKRNDTS